MLVRELYVVTLINPRTAERLFLHERRGDAKLQPPSNFGTRRDTNMISVSTPMFSGSRFSTVLVPTLSDAPFSRKSRWRTRNRKRVKNKTHMPEKCRKIWNFNRIRSVLAVGCQVSIKLSSRNHENSKWRPVNRKYL